MNFHHCFPHFENWHGKKPIVSYIQFWVGWKIIFYPKCNWNILSTLKLILKITLPPFWGANKARISMKSG